MSIEFQNETQRKVNPFKLQNFLSDKFNQKVKKLTTDSKFEFSFKVKKNEELNLSSEFENFEDLHCENIFHKSLNQTKEFIYI